MSNNNSCGEPPQPCKCNSNYVNVDYSTFIPIKEAIPKTVYYPKVEHIAKKWGYESIIHNDEHYCGKILHFRKGAKCSSHFHLKKRESFYIISGRFIIKSINADNADEITTILPAGTSLTIPIGVPHQIICQEEGDIAEFSSQHFDSDSYRVAKGDSQG